MNLNYEMLKLKNPTLHALVENERDMKVEPIVCTNGLVTAKVETYEGKHILLHSKYDPYKDIAQNVSKFNSHSSLIVYIGFGLGYELKEIYSRKSFGTKIVVIEPRLDLLKLALDTNNITELLTSEDVFLIGGNVEQITLQVQSVASHLVSTLSNIDVHESNYSGRVYPKDLILEIISEFSGAMAYGMKRLGNDAEDNLLGINHIFSNIPYILESPDLSTLDLYKSFPAVCVASGPSLDKNIDVLYEYQDRVLIFCADSAVDKLLAKGIIPDAVVAAERTKGLYTQLFEGKMDHWDPRICLIAQAVVYPKIFEEFQGKKVVCSKLAITFDNRISKYVKGMNNFDTGSSCAHISFGIARMLQCNPIILMGQDLAYSDQGISHATGTYGENTTIRDEENRQVKTLYVKSIDQNSKILTNEFWDLFRRWFEQSILQYPENTYINATEGGAHIIGTEVMSLRDALTRHCDQDKVPFHRGLELLPYRLSDSIEEDRSRLIEYLEEELEILHGIKKNLSDCVDKISEIERLHRKGKLEAKFMKGATILSNGTDFLGAAIKKSTIFSYIVQAITARAMQYINANRRITSAEELNQMAEFVSRKALEISKVADITIKEYERGLTIVKTGHVETIDTELLGEMYRW